MAAAVQAFLGLPKAQLLFGALFMLTSAIGGNLVFHLHKRRTGKKSSLVENPFAHMANFNAKEWLWLALVVLLSIAFLVLAVHTPSFS